MQLIKQFQNAYEEVIENTADLHTKQLSEFIEQCEAIHSGYEGSWLSPNHNLEIYLCEYFIQMEGYSCTQYKIHELYRKLAEKFIEEDNAEEAMKAFEKSLNWNPVDLDTRFAFAKLYRDLGDWECYLKTVQDSYPFCYSRSDMAKYYRDLGCYYLEIYRPEIAEALYTYSNLFYMSDMAENEISFLETALKRERRQYSYEDLQQILAKEGIPEHPDKSTLALLYRVGKLEQENGNPAYAKYLYVFLYQLTRDEEIEQILKTI